MPATSAAAKAVAGGGRQGLQHVHEGKRENPGHLVVRENLVVKARFWKPADRRMPRASFVTQVNYM